MNEIPYVDALRRELLRAATRQQTRRRRKRLLAVAASCAVSLLAVTGVALSDLRWFQPPPGVEAIPKGPTVTVKEGRIGAEPWRLTARRVDRHDLCVGVQFGPGWGEGCVDEEFPVGFQVGTSAVPVPATFVHGHVAPDVTAVVIRLGDGSRHRVRALTAEGFDVKFYVRAFPGHVDVRGVTGLDADGKVMGRSRYTGSGAEFERGGLARASVSPRAN